MSSVTSEDIATPRTKDWKLARIRAARLFIEDHGFLTWFLDLEYAEPGTKIGGTGQGFGGYAVAVAKMDRKPHLDVSGFGAWTIVGVLKSVGVEDWADLAGKMVWVDAEWSKVHSIRGVDTGIEFRPEEWNEPYEEMGN